MLLVWEILQPDFRNILRGPAGHFLRISSLSCTTSEEHAFPPPFISNLHQTCLHAHKLTHVFLLQSEGRDDIVGPVFHAGEVIATHLPDDDGHLQERFHPNPCLL